MIHAISSLSLLAFFVCCISAVFYERFRCTWLQLLGMFGLALWSAARLHDVINGAPVSQQQLLAHVSLALYAVGTAIKVMRREN